MIGWLSILDIDKDKLHSALLDAMRPFARLMLNAGVNCQEFESLTRKAFVEAAAREQDSRGKAPSSARISAITGLSRADVRAALASPEAEVEETGTFRLAPSDVLHFWQHDADYVAENGTPMPLPFEGSKPSFTSLVQRYGHGESPTWVRSALLEAGSMSESETGMLEFQKPHFIPRSMEDRLLVVLRKNLRALLSTAVYNFEKEGDGPGRISRFVYTDGLTEAQIEGFRSSVRTHVKQFTEELDLEFSKMEEENRGNSRPPAGRAVAVGVYFFEEDPSID